MPPEQRKCNVCRQWYWVEPRRGGRTMCRSCRAARADRPKLNSGQEPRPADLGDRIAALAERAAAGAPLFTARRCDRVRGDDR